MNLRRLVVLNDAEFVAMWLIIAVWYDSSLKGGRPIITKRDTTEIEQSHKQLNGLHVSSNSMNRIQFAI